MRGTSLAGGLVLLLLGPAAAGWAQPSPYFERIQSADGLSHNSVYAVVQDRAGFMWFGTVDGLNRYDGYGFTVYRHDAADTTSLANGLVRAIYEDRRGRLWVGTEGGVDRLDRPTGRFVHVPVPAGCGLVTALAEDAAGRLWAASMGGLLWLDVAAGRFRRAPWWRRGEAAMDLALDPAGRLWALGVEGEAIGEHVARLYRLGGTARSAETLGVDGAWGGVVRFDFDRDGRPWLNDRGPGVRTGGSVRPSHPERSGSAYEVVRAASGELWVGTTDRRGVCRADGDRLDCHVPDPESQTWLHNYVRSILVDRAGVLWAGTYGGVYRHDPHRKPFALLQHDPHDANSLSA
ncbi:MAG TPA: two-component regulator propeller domain-containing protein, partial [Rhodothermales bacterium]|nr:two-component regulator propeller domain-containing protein [Rhodothermales bacterium]